MMIIDFDRRLKDLYTFYLVLGVGLLLEIVCVFVMGIHFVFLSSRTHCAIVCCMKVCQE